MMSFPVWLPGPMFILRVSVPGPMFFPGGLCPVGSLSREVSVQRGRLSGGSRILMMGGAPTPEILLFCKYFVKNCMKMKEFGPAGGCASLAPYLRSANGLCPEDFCRDSLPFQNQKSRQYASYWNPFL